MYRETSEIALLDVDLLLCPRGWWLQRSRILLYEGHCMREISRIIHLIVDKKDVGIIATPVSSYKLYYTSLG